ARDVLENEGSQGQHRGPDLLALANVALAGRGLDEVVDERVDPARARGAEELDLLARQVDRVEHASADRVVDVVVDVGDAVDYADDPSLERLGLVRSGVVEDAVA